MTQRFRELPGHWMGILAAVLLWCLLWGSFGASDILGGLLAAVIVFLLFPLPPLHRELTLRPLMFVLFVARFIWDMTVSGVQVAWYAIRPGPKPPSSVIAVTMASRSDLFLTITAVLSTLIPGSVVVEAQRSTGTLYVHVIGVGTADEVENSKQQVRHQERRALFAVGHREVLREADLG